MLASARTLFRYRALLATLVVRELKGRYRGSVLGFLWSLAQPLLLLLVYSLVFGYVFQPRLAGADPYPLFLICGLFPWIWLSTAWTEGTVSLTANSGLIRRSVFPVELLAAVPVVSNLIHFLLALPVIAAGLFWGRLNGWPVSGWGALALPLIILVQLPLVAGGSLALAALHAHFKDVRDLLVSVLTLAFFLQPILYRIDSIPLELLRRVVRIVPFTPFALAYQQALFEGRFPEPRLWAEMVAVTAVAWAIGSFIFGRLRETLVEAV